MEPYDVKEVLEKEYKQEKRTIQQVADLYGVNYSVIQCRLKKFGIPPNPKWNFGKKCPIHGKRVWYICPNGETVSMRSNWEACYADWLNLNSIKWEYEPKTFILNSGEAYTPDFFLLNTNEYIEVKGWLHNKHKAKIESFKESYPNEKLIIANKEYLKEIKCDLTKKHPSNKPDTNKICQICDVRFEPKYKKQIICSAKCRNKYIACKEQYPQISIISKSQKRPGTYNQIGSKNNSSKLTEEQALRIINLRKNGESLKKIAAEINVSIGNIGNIVKGRSWKHLKNRV